MIYLSGDANDEPAAHHDDAGAEPRRQHGRPARGHAALCKASAAPGGTLNMTHVGQKMLSFNVLFAATSPVRVAEWSHVGHQRPAGQDATAGAAAENLAVGHVPGKSTNFK